MGLVASTILGTQNEVRPDTGSRRRFLLPIPRRLVPRPLDDPVLLFTTARQRV
jgi:hypothetical protein